MLPQLLQGVKFPSVSSTSAWEWALQTLKPPQKNHRSQDPDSGAENTLSTSQASDFVVAQDTGNWFCLHPCTLPSASSAYSPIAAFRFFFFRLWYMTNAEQGQLLQFSIYSLEQLFLNPLQSLEELQSRKRLILQCDWLLYDVIATTHIFPWYKLLAFRKKRVNSWAYLWISCRLTTFIEKDSVHTLLLYYFVGKPVSSFN